jgi:hypothetical protein
MNDLQTRVKGCTAPRTASTSAVARVRHCCCEYSPRGSGGLSHRRDPYAGSSYRDISAQDLNYPAINNPAVLVEQVAHLARRFGAICSRYQSIATSPPLTSAGWPNSTSSSDQAHRITGVTITGLQMAFNLNPTGCVHNEVKLIKTIRGLFGRCRNSGCSHGRMSDQSSQWVRNADPIVAATSTATALPITPITRLR